MKEAGCARTNVVFCCNNMMKLSHKWIWPRIYIKECERFHILLDPISFYIIQNIFIIEKTVKFFRFVTNFW